MKTITITLSEELAKDIEGSLDMYRYEVSKTFGTASPMWKDAQATCATFRRLVANAKEDAK